MYKVDKLASPCSFSTRHDNMTIVSGGWNEVDRILLMDRIVVKITMVVYGADTKVWRLVLNPAVS